MTDGDRRERADGRRCWRRSKPASLEATGVAPDTLASILIKMLHSGEASGMGLADRVCLPYGILEPLLEKLRVELLVR